MADLIDRDAVAYKVKSCITIPADNEWDSGYNTAMAEAKQYIENAPAVNRWIPCSERLPESFIYVLCAGRDGIGILRYIGSKWLDDEAHAYTTNEITHWMPLPEPPESEVQNENAD